MEPSVACLRTLRAASVLLLASVSATYGQESADSALVRRLNGELLNYEKTFRSLPPQAAEAAKAQAEAAGAQRRGVLLRLMRSNPAEALRAALPESAAAQLRETFPSLAALIEMTGSFTGMLEHSIADRMDARTAESRYLLKTGGTELQIYFASAAASRLRSGQLVEAKGVSLSGEVAAQDGTVLSSTAAAGLTCSTTGPQKILVLLVNFASAALPTSVTPDLVRGILLGNAYASTASTPDWSVSDFWQQNSDGQLSVDAAGSTVYGPITLATNYATCDYDAIRREAMAAADPFVNYQNYSRVMVVFPNTGVCSWAGLGTVGCTSYATADGTNTTSMAWLRADQMASRSAGVRLFTHELGHNLGLHHASSRAYTSEALGALGAAGTLDEYGDRFSTMGFWNFGFYSAQHATNQLGWLTTSAVSGMPNVQVVETSGTYTIQNYEARPAGMKGLRVRRGTGNNAWLWIEARRNTGIYDSQIGSQVFSGALIHYEDSTTGARTHLPDFTPGSASGFTDPALVLGSSWTDPYSNLRLSVTGSTATSLTVQVDYGALPCVRGVPVVTLSPSSLAVAQGSSGSFTVAVRNGDSAGCPAAAFDLRASLPDAAWTYALGSATLTINPGQSASTTYRVTPPATVSAGSFLAGITAVHSAAPTMTGSASAGVTVTVPNYALVVSVTNGGSVQATPPGATCTRNCSYSLPKGTVTTLTAKPDKNYVFTGWGGACAAAGTSLTCSMTMDAAKSASAAYKRGR